jgi:hypothetical protein
MPTNQTPGTLEAISLELVKIFDPLKERIQQGEVLLLLAELGVDFPDTLESNTAFTNAIGDVAAKLYSLPPIISSLITAISAENWSAVGSASIQLTQTIANIVDDCLTIKGALDQFSATWPGVDQAALEQFLEDFVSNLLQYLLVTYIERASPVIAAVFEFFGIIEREDATTINTLGAGTPFVRKRIHLNNLSQFFKDPGLLAETLYGWGLPTFDGLQLLRKLQKLALSLGLPAVLTEAPPSLDVFIFKIEPDTTLNPRGIRFLVSESFRLNGTYALNNPNFTLAFTAGAVLPVEFGLTLQPGLQIGIVPLGIPAPISGDLGVAFSLPGTAGAGQPFIAIGSAGGSRFEFTRFTARGSVGLTWDTGAGTANGRFGVEGELQGGKIVIKASNPDGFLGKVLPPDGFIIDLDLLMGYDSSRGFYFDGSGGLEVQIPLHLQLGPILIDSITLSIKAGSQGIPIGLGADVGISLGPFQAVVQNMGILANFTFPPDNTGNLSFMNVDIGFKPPTGVGLSLDATVIKGGGFLKFEFDIGKYTGIAQLSIQNVVNVVAIAIITTKNPDGSPGFSMLLLITAEFTPIQLSFGFTLNGVGGLIGVNRTMILQALRDGVRNNAIDNIMFPSNPIANATQIISALETIFPQQQGRYTFGIMGIIGWGTPTLIELEIGLMLEVPNPIRLAILGVIKMVLPTEEAAILQLKVAFVGTIDFEAEYITFDASIFDSKLLTFTLEGDMALRIKWGSNSNFLFTLGGFHPDYTPPPLDLPQLRRLSITLFAGNPRLIISTYFAVTSNTVQFGAGIDFHFEAGPARIEGWFNFDALFQFNPFYFKITLSAGLSVYAFGGELMTISFDGSLEGPTPWHITGRVRIKIIFIINISASVETTWGESANTSIPDIDVLPKLKEALANKANWITPVEDGSDTADSMVTLRTITNTAESIIAHPDKSLAVSQKIVPLDIEINLFGTAKPADYTRFSIELENLDETPVKEEFAPAQFFKITEKEKLSRPSFEKYNSGVSATGSNTLTSDFFRERDVMFEQIIIDDFDLPAVKPPLSVFDKSRFNAFIRNGSAARNKFGSKSKMTSPLSPPKVKVPEKNYAVVSTDDLSVFSGMTASTITEANLMMQQAVMQNPSLEGQLDIIPSYQSH